MTPEHKANKMKPSSAKNKGREGQKEVITLLQDLLEEMTGVWYSDDYFKSTSMGAGGEDIFLSPEIRKHIPWQVEVKRNKKKAICRDIEQARSHGKHLPIVIFREDHDKGRGANKPWCVALEWDVFKQILENKNGV